MTIVRSVLAVVAGLAVTMVLVVALTWLAVQLMLGGDWTAAPTPAYLGINLTYSFLAAVAGGWLAARIAARREILHAGVVAVVMLLLSLAGDANPPEGGVPEWYSPVIGVLGAAGALVGGWLRATALRRRSGSGQTAGR